MTCTLGSKYLLNSTNFMSKSFLSNDCWFSLTTVSILRKAGHAIKDCKHTFIKQLIFALARPLLTLSKFVIEKCRVDVSFRLMSWLLNFFV